jgi:hypothetical protein
MIRFLRHSFGLVGHLGANGFFKACSTLAKGAILAARGGLFVVLCSLYADQALIFKQKTFI